MSTTIFDYHIVFDVPYRYVPFILRSKFASKTCAEQRISCSTLSSIFTLPKRFEINCYIWDLVIIIISPGFGARCYLQLQERNKK
jgi:hypothetical protein